MKRIMGGHSTAITAICEDCKGEGILNHNTCKTCEGTGMVKVRREVFTSITIKPHIPKQLEEKLLTLQQ